MGYARFQILATIPKKFRLNGFRTWNVGVPRWNNPGCEMRDAKTYRQYADDCRRIAQSMNAKDKAVMLEMARVWEERADEAERAEARKSKHQRPQSDA